MDHLDYEDASADESAYWDSVYAAYEAEQEAVYRAEEREMRIFCADVFGGPEPE
jgi:hypothetical protein